MVLPDLRIPLIIAATLLAADAQAQSTWTQLFPTTNPGPRFGHAMAFDSVHGLTLLYGGYSSATNQYLSDTWSWDGVNWQHLTPIGPTPGQRFEYAMFFHSALGQIVLVGGHAAGSYVMDTWRWNGSSWQQILASGGSLVQTSQTVAYDPIRNTAVAFDGNRTCEWSNASASGWQQRTTALTPSGGSGAMAFDSAAGMMVLFTGGQTWNYDGINWTLRQPSVNPAARTLTTLAFDTGRGEAVLFGGYTGVQLNDTWVWNGTTWAQLIAPNPPPPRQQHGIAYDSVRQRVVMYGGNTGTADTWIKNPTSGAPATVTSYGAGCPGSGGVPTLAAFGGTQPWIGTGLTLQMQSLPVLIFRAPFGILGLSQTTWGPTPLPAALDPVGMPGCSALVSVDDIRPLTNSFGTALWTIQIPNAVGLVGGHFYAQGLVVDPPTNVFGAVVSNALDCLIGAR
jgi:hypothetical protein